MHRPKGSVRGVLHVLHDRGGGTEKHVRDLVAATRPHFRHHVLRALSDRYRLIGTVRGAPPHRGRLVHHGWEAAKCEVPEWSGNSVAAQVLAPVEVELLG